MARDGVIPLPVSPRLLPVPPAERDDRVRELLADFVVGPTAHIYETMARHPEVLARCIPLGRQLRGGRLSLRERELLILRSGWRCRSEYEWAQHSRLARAGGMSDDELLRIAAGPDDPGWEPHESMLLRAADELHEQSCVSSATWAALATRYDEQELIEIVMLCGYYHLIAYFLNSTGVEIEEGTPGFPPGLGGPGQPVPERGAGGPI